LPLQLREDKKSEVWTGSEWMDRSQTLRESTKETEWGLVDGSGTELPVVQGYKAHGQYLQMSGDRL
jgi:hypothetical protein